MSNNPGLTGFGQHGCARSEQMAAFDMLPGAVREALRNATVSFSPIQALELCREHGEAVVLRSLAAADSNARAAMRTEMAEACAA